MQPKTSVWRDAVGSGWTVSRLHTRWRQAQQSQCEKMAGDPEGRNGTIIRCTLDSDLVDVGSKLKRVIKK